MLTVREHPIQPGANVLELPAAAQFVRVGTLRGRGAVWAVESSDYIEPRPRKLLVVATGEAIPAGGPIKYLGSFDLLESVTFHVFEVFVT